MVLQDRPDILDRPTVTPPAADPTYDIFKEFSTDALLELLHLSWSIGAPRVTDAEQYADMCPLAVCMARDGIPVSSRFMNNAKRPDSLTVAQSLLDRRMLPDDPRALSEVAERFIPEWDGHELTNEAFRKNIRRIIAAR